MSRSVHKKGRKVKVTSALPLYMTAGFFLGIGLGALMGNILPVIVLGLLGGAALGYYLDRKNKVAYTRRGKSQHGHG